MKNKLINKLLIVFLIIQPIFDIKIFYNSISTLIRVIIILGLFLYYFITDKNKKKYYMLIYPCLIGVYFCMHHLNALHFTSLVPGNFNYSVIQEALYFVKMLAPFMLIYSLYKANFSNEQLTDFMKYLVLIISLIIIVSNLFVFSYGSYSDIKIKANVFEWFNPQTEYTYQDLASKGLFEYANQISAILIMFLPFIIYATFKKASWLNFVTLASNIFALILLCTKVSVLGILVVFIYTSSIIVFNLFLEKKQHHKAKQSILVISKQYIPLFCILLVYFALLPFNPMISRMQERRTISEMVDENPVIENSTIEKTEIIDNTSLNKDTSYTTENDNASFKIEYIENNYEKKKVHKQFLFENYPYKYDVDFWYDFLQNEISVTTDYRLIEKAMIKRVVEINNNPMDKLFGITNTRLQNIFNIEKDFVVQYYALGIIGLILIFAPYFIVLGLFVYKTIKAKLKNLTVINLLSFITIIFIFGISYMSGNLLNSLSFTIYFTLCFVLINRNN